MSKTARKSDGPAPSAAPLPSPGELVVVGKDVLELLSSAMYIDPLTIYREYVQNAADAIDEARANGWLGASAPGAVVIALDPDSRTIRIRDNGAGIPVRDAAARLLAIGASAKRGTSARGFRGVGRLAGLAYARQLVFRTRSKGDRDVFELRWDCLRLKAALREVGQNDDLPGVLNRIVHIETRPAAVDEPAHFFEVELNDVVRHHRRDALLNEDMVADYLAEVAPVPFDEAFRWRDQLVTHLAPHVRLGDLEVRVGDRPPLRRPLQNRFPVSDAAEDAFADLELLTFAGRDGDTAAVGWLLHHSYLGALPDRARIKGLRLRCGNVQVGESQILEASFPEPRFNSWAVGEIHILDPRIVPNARRDNFEQNVHFADLTAQVEPISRRIARTCRAASIERNRAKAMEAAAKGAVERLRDHGIASVPQRVIPQLHSCTRSMIALLRELPRSAHAEPVGRALKDLEAQLSAAQQEEPKAHLITQLRTALEEGILTKQDLKDLTKDPAGRA